MIKHKNICTKHPIEFRSFICDVQLKLLFNSYNIVIFSFLFLFSTVDCVLFKHIIRV